MIKSARIIIILKNIQNLETFSVALGIVLVGAFGFLIFGIVYCCQNKKKNPSDVAPENETNLDEVIIDGQSQAEPNDSISSQETSSHQDKNLEIDDLPTFDEALEMEVVNVENSQHKLRRRFSSRVSMQSDELPDYESVTYETYVTTKKTNQCNPSQCPNTTQSSIF